MVTVSRSLAFISFATLMFSLGCGRSTGPQPQPSVDVGAAAAGGASSSASPDPAVSADGDFAWALYGRLARVSDNDSGNLFFSPSSLKTALTMLWAGADGATRAEIGDALELAAGADPVADQRAILAALNRPGEETRITSVNRLWGAAEETFLASYTSLLKDRMGAGFQAVDFAASEEARGIINAWVSEHTHGNIPELIAPGILSGQTRLVLTNAVDFLGQWKQAFDPDETIPNVPFKAPGAAEQPMVSLMAQTAELPYASVTVEGHGVFEAVELGYDDPSLAMTVILPPAGVSLSEVSEALPRAYEAAAKGFSTQKVRVLLPRFTLRWSDSLRDDLETLGMRAVFTDSADLSKMNGKTDLYVSAVVHEAFVKVDEAGTAAAAATAVVVGRKGIERVQTFRCDRPFVFLIHDKATGEIVFMGQLNNPTAG